MAQQTAVDWLVSELNHCLESNGKIEVVPELLVKLQEQANKIHKEQIIDSDLNATMRSARGLNANVSVSRVKELAEQYYNETYGTDKTA
jgi:hypothetical protein